MIKQSTFPIRTGELTYKIGLNVQNTTGQWSVKLGFSGVNESSWGISGCSGKIYDYTGYNIGSYINNVDYTISGSIFDNRHSIFQNGVLLSNQSKHISNDYDFVRVESNYTNQYVPSVVVEGQDIQDTAGRQTHQFWKEPNDRIYFATENGEADKGFVNKLTAMGFTVHTGNQSGVSGGKNLDEFYNLVILGSATTSGNYKQGNWNSLNTNVMCLNSFLAGDGGGLNWYESASNYLPGTPLGKKTATNQAAERVSGSNIWFDFPSEGWEQLFYVGELSDASNSYYLPYGITDTNDTDRFVHFGVGLWTAWLGNNSTFESFSDPIGPDDLLPFDLGPTSWTIDLNNITSYMSNEYGGTGIQDYSADGDFQEDRIENRHKLLPSVPTYDTNLIFRKTSISDGEGFDMYTGVSDSFFGFLGETVVGTPELEKLITVWHKGMWTGEYIDYTDLEDYYTLGKHTQQERFMVFSVTNFDNNWQNGQDMWETLTPTGKRLFANSVVGFFN